MADDSDDPSTLTIYRRPGNSPATPNVKFTAMPPGFDPLASPTDASARVAGIKFTAMPPGFDPLAPSIYIKYESAYCQKAKCRCPTIHTPNPNPNSEA